jgi:hypothetical protein
VQEFSDRVFETDIGISLQQFCLAEQEFFASQTETIFKAWSTATLWPE